MSPFVFSQLKREGSFSFNSCSGVTEDNHFLSTPGSIFLDFSFGDPLLPVGEKNHTSYTRNMRFLPKVLYTVNENVNPLCLSNSQLSEFFPYTHLRVFFFLSDIPFHSFHSNRIVQ